MGLCETIYSAGPPPVFGTRALGLFLGTPDSDALVAPPGVAPHTGGTSRTRAKRAGESSTPRTSTPSKRSELPVMVCSARVRTALLAVCQEFPQGGCYPGDGHGLQGKGPQPPLHRRTGQPRPGLS